jgi:hypothetical protein
MKERVMTVEHSKTVADLASVSVVIATLASWLPAVAALISIVWTLIRIYETKTVQGWLGRRNRKGKHEEGSKAN